MLACIRYLVSDVLSSRRPGWKKCLIPLAGSLWDKQDKVDVVKMTMQDNIQQMLANEERLDQISENAENLNEQVSSAFPRYFRFARNLCLQRRLC